MFRGSARQAQPISGAQPSTWACGATIAVVGLLVYVNSLNGPFVFDDFVSIVDNRSIHDWSRLSEVLFPERELPTAGRPLVNFSFALNYAVGGLDVTGYHVVNIAFHLGCAVVLFGIIRRTLELPRVKTSSAPSVPVAFATALLWTVHPLNTEAVDYVTQRTELMMALCYLLTIYAALRARTSTMSSAWSVIAIAVCAAGMVCKESMVTAPLTVALYDRVFLFDSLKQAFRARRRLYIGLVTTWIVAIWVLSSGPRIHSAGFSTGVGPWVYLLNQTVMIDRYLWLAVWPRDLVANYGSPSQLSIRDVAPYALGVIGLVAIAAAGLARRPKMGFLGAWFFITLAPASSIVPIATEVGAERRMYLPLIAIVGVVVVIGAYLAERAGRPGRLATLLALALVSLGLATGTVLRNRDYQSALVLARTTVARYPSSVAHHLLATELIAVGNRDQARVQLREALPGDSRAHYTLGVELLKDGDLEGATSELEAFLRGQPLLLEAVSARQLLGRALARQERWPDAIDQYRRVLTMNPSDQVRVETQMFLGEALYRARRFDEAVTSYTEYLKARPNDVDALNVLGICFLALDRGNEAIAMFTRAVSIDSENGMSQRNLGNALFDSGDIDGAAVHAREAARLRIDDPGAWDLLGRVSAVQGDVQDARADFARALRIDPGFSEATEHLQALNNRLVRGSPVRP